MSVSYLPGQYVDVGTATDPIQFIGYGLEQRNSTEEEPTTRIVACQPGLLRVHGNKAWISVQNKRYIPCKGDRVLAVVTGKQGEFFKLDIGSADNGLINFLSFEGATKRNRPNLKTGDVLYAQVTEASKHLEPELTCVDSVARAKGLGLLQEGLLFKVSLHLGRRLISPECKLLKLVGKEWKFEITVGLNGRVWIKTDDVHHTIAIRRIIVDAEYILEENIPSFVETAIMRAKGVTPAEQMDTS